MKIVSSAEMREIDRVTSERFGVPSLTLMENAGSAVAEFALPFNPRAETFGVICGKGNNGGDGFVIARKLHDAGREVRLLLLADPTELRGDAAANYASFTKASQISHSSKTAKGGTPEPVIAKSAGDLRSDAAQAVFNCDVLIDAILGSGFKPPVRGVYAE